MVKLHSFDTKAGFNFLFWNYMENWLRFWFFFPFIFLAFTADSQGGYNGFIQGWRMGWGVEDQLCAHVVKGFIYSEVVSVLWWTVYAVKSQQAITVCRNIFEESGFQISM